MPDSDPSPAAVHVEVTDTDFDLGWHYAQLGLSEQVGAITCFVGRVRDFVGDGERALWLEHYPGMTEGVLREIAVRALERWQLSSVRVVHRIGHLPVGAQIVLVGTAAAHRQASLDACAYIMDLLKTEAPFWKRQGSRWVEARSGDAVQAARWDDA